MSFTLPIITYGGGELLREFFNAIVVSFGDSGFKTLMRLSIMLGGLWALFDSITKRNMMLNVKWVCLYILVTNLLFIPKTSINIIDQTQSGKVYTVDNVPLGLAILANLTSNIGDGLTQLTEKNFSLPDDLRYGKTGMIFASELITAASQYQVTDPTFSSSLQSYVQQCVFYDLLLNKYSISDLLNTPQLWSFLRVNSSPARAFLYKGEVTICRDGVALLDHDWYNAIQEAASKYGSQLLRNSMNPKVDLLQYLQTGYGFLTKTADTGAQILQQNLLASQINEGLQHFSAVTNSTAALASYSFTKAQTQKRMSNKTIGDMATYWLPLMKTCFEGILYGSFLFIILLSLFPFGLSVLKNYIASLVWIQIWAPLYAIINLMVSYHAQTKSMTLMSGGLTLAAMGGLNQINSDMAGLAGYLSLSVPFIAWGLIRGMGSTFTQLAQFIGGVTQSAAISAAGEAITGNLSLGNTHFANRSQFNTNANHVDTNARYMSGIATLQTPMGSTVSITPSGTEIMDNRAALSNLGVSVNVSDSIREAASTQSQMSVTAGLSQTKAAASHYSTALRVLDDLANQKSSFTSSGNSMSNTESTGLGHSAHVVSQLVDSFAKEHHISHERAMQVMGQVYADTKVGGGFIIKGETGASMSVSGSGRSAFGSLYNDAHRFAVDHNFTETVDTASRTAKESHYRESNDMGNRYAHSIANSFDQGDVLRHEATSNFTKAKNYSELASRTFENAASVNANYTQEFYEWMKQQPSIMGHGKMSRSAIENMAVHDPALLQNYANRFVQTKTSQVMSTAKLTRSADKEDAIQAAFYSNNQSLPTTSNIGRENQQNLQTIQSAVSQAKISEVDHHIDLKINHQIVEHQAKLKEEKTDLEDSSDPLKHQIHEKVQGQVIGSLNAIESLHEKRK